jgi:hypothetical protein
MSLRNQDGSKPEKAGFAHNAPRKKRNEQVPEMRPRMASQKPSQRRQEPLEGHDQETTLGGNEAGEGEGNIFCQRRQ